MKRFLTFALALIASLSLISCESKDTEYRGSLGENANVTLVLDGIKATITSIEKKSEKIDGNIVEITTKKTVVGVIEKNEEGVITVNINTQGASATYKLTLGGKGYDEYRKAQLDSFSEMPDGKTKTAMINLAKGKTVKMEFGDELWNILGPGGEEETVIVLKLDKENLTFEQIKTEKED